MKNSILVISAFFIFLGCKTNSVPVSKENNSSIDYNHVFANIFVDDIKRSEIGNYVVTVFKYSSKNEIPSQETHENYTNYVVSVANEGEFVQSQLFEIKNQILPVIKRILINDNNLLISIEQGNKLDRESKELKFKLDF